MSRSVFLISVLWALVSVSAATAAGLFAYGDPSGFFSVVDLLATIISILVGVSLAVIAVLVSPFSASSEKAKDEFEAKRITNIVHEHDEILALGQILLFGLYLLALLSALIFKWMFVPDVNAHSDNLRSLAALTGFLGILAFFWSARLPFMLSAISRQRKALG